MIKKIFRKIRYQLTTYFLSVSGRLFFYTLIPPLILTFVLCLFFSAYVVDYHHRIFQQTVLADYYHIQSSLQYGLYTDQHEVIDKAFKKITQGELKRLDILDRNGLLLYSSDKTVQLEKLGQPLKEENKFTLFSKEASYTVTMANHSLPDFIDVDDFLIESFTGFGTAVFYYHLDNFWVDHRNILSLGLFLFFQSVFLSFLLTRYVDLRLTKPIIELIKAMRSLKKNSFALDLAEPSFGEMNRLQRSAVKMANSLRQAHQELQEKIDEATSSLRKYVRKVQEQKKALEIAHKKAEAVSESKSQILAHISHEYKTPLNSVIGFIDLLMQDPLNAQQRSYCQTIKSSAQHLLMMINDILDFNLIEAGKLSIVKKQMNLRDCLEDVISTLTPLANEKELYFDYLYYEDVPLIIHSDPHRLRQVLINLIANAIKFTEKGSVIIRVSLSEKSHPHPPAEFFEISIEDTGVGIQSHIEKNLFTPFCHVLGRHQFGGTGLGLAITKKILSSLQAEISYHTKVGVGTTFIIHGQTNLVEEKNLDLLEQKSRIRLRSQIALFHHSTKPPAMEHHLRYLGYKVISFPSFELFEKSLLTFDKYLFFIQDSQDREKAMNLVSRHSLEYETIIFYGYSQRLLTSFDGKFKTLLLPMRTSLIAKVLSRKEKKFQIKSQINADTNKKKVLLVDDNCINTKILYSYLNQYPIEIIVLNKSEFFLSTVEQNSFQMIFLDIFMPKLNGLECLELYKKRFPVSYSKTPVIAVTANSLANENDSLLKKGFIEVLYKPLCPDLLERILKDYLFSCTDYSFNKVDNFSHFFELKDSWPKILDQLKEGIKASFACFEQEDFLKMRHEIHSLVGLTSYYKSLNSTYEILSQLEYELSRAKIESKKVFQLLKRLSKTAILTQ